MKTAFAVIAVTIMAKAMTTETEYVKSFDGRNNIPVPVKVATPRVGNEHAGETINVSFYVTVTGKVEKVKLDESLDTETKNSIVDAVSKWEFKPMIINGAPVKTAVVLPMKITGL